MQRLGVQGAWQVKSHAFFENLDWAKVEQLEQTPPFVPRPVVEDPTFDSGDLFFAEGDKGSDVWSMARNFDDSESVKTATVDPNSKSTDENWGDFEFINFRLLRERSEEAFLQAI
jgi:hypothetical protein